MIKYKRQKENAEERKHLPANNRKKHQNPF